MSCKTPVIMYRDKNGRDTATGNWPLVSSPSDGYSDLPVKRPCGKCVFCRLDNSRQKTVRLTHELQSWSMSSFLTLTYDENNLPLSSKGVPTLTRGQQGHMTLFMKRLRKATGFPLKSFQCGEYGERTARPHHHMILYGYDFSDNRQIASSNPTTYTSPILSNLWPYGGHRIGTVTWDSASYVAAYCVKKLTGDQAKTAYHDVGIEPPFTTSSLGIGKDWISTWLHDVYPRDYIVVKGHKQRPPRYYDDYLKKVNLDMYKDVMIDRQKRGEEKEADNFEKAISANVLKDKALQFFSNPKL